MTTTERATYLDVLDRHLLTSPPLARCGLFDQAGYHHWRHYNVGGVSMCEDCIRRIAPDVTLINGALEEMLALGAQSAGEAAKIIADTGA